MSELCSYFADTPIFLSFFIKQCGASRRGGQSDDEKDNGNGMQYSASLAQAGHEQEIAAYPERD